MAAVAALAPLRPFLPPRHVRLALLIAVSAAVHAGVLLLIAPGGRPMAEPQGRAPLLIDITPPLAPAAAAPKPAPPAAAPPASSGPPLPPVAVRARPPDAPRVPADVAPLAVEPAPVRVTTPGRVIPRSWRERCDLPPEGPVDDAALRDCERRIVASAAPPARPVRRGGADHAADFAAQGARRLARYEYLRAPQTPGGANARPSDEPGSNYGMGGIRDSVVTITRSGPGGTGAPPGD